MSELKYKIIDFGLAVSTKEEQKKIIGSPAYISPHIWDEYPWYPKQNDDIYSLSITVMEMGTYLNMPDFMDTTTTPPQKMFDCLNYGITKSSGHWDFDKQLTAKW